MNKIGITGGIGSGKTIVCKVFEQLGIPVFYADEESKKILDEDVKVKSEIIQLFGEEVFLPNGNADRKTLGEKVFNDEKELRRLNAILHPVVLQNFSAWAERQKGVPYIIKEAAILFESGANKGLDYVISVSCPLELRITRVMQRDHVNREFVVARIQKQLSEEERNLKSNFIILNDDQHPVLQQVIELHEKLKALK